MTDRIVEAGQLIRAHLLPLWDRLHRTDLRFGRSSAIPDPLSTHMCRHSTLFARRALSKAGISGWKPVAGSLCRHSSPRLPAGLDDGAALLLWPDRLPHTWLESRSGIRLDITADQFGLPPVLAAPADDPIFRPYRAEWPARISALRPTILNWEGHPSGSWQEADLAPLRTGYATLVASLRDILSRG